MKKYKISDSVNLDAFSDTTTFIPSSLSTYSAPKRKQEMSKLALKAGAAFAFFPALALPIIVPGVRFFFPELALPLMAYNLIIDASAKKIDTIAQLRQYKNCVGDLWKHKVEYIEHPKIKKALIPKKVYADFVVQDMIADIAGFIMDSIPTKEITIGIIHSKGKSASVSIPAPVEGYPINANAEYTVKLLKDYYTHYVDTKIAYPRTHYWIDAFPELKEAINHDVSHFERRVKIDFASQFGIGIEKFGGSISSYSKGELFIHYTHA